MKNTATPPRADVYERVTSAIIARLEQGVIPWQAPYKAGTYEAPRNYASGRFYTGMNYFLLNSTTHERPYFLTFNQIQEEGGRIRKGAKGEIVTFWKIIEATKRAEAFSQEKPDQIPLVKLYHVFNVSDVEGIDINLPERPDVSPYERVQRCEELIARMPNAPEIQHSSTTLAYYNKARDFVHVPESGYFLNREEYYNTLFHELIHSTGHEKRLNRPELCQNSKYGSNTYSREELTAEMGAAMLSGVCGLTCEDVLNNSASYIEHWLRRLREDSHFLIHAAASAQRAVNFITENSEKGGEQG